MTPPAGNGNGDDLLKEVRAGEIVDYVTEYVNAPDEKTARKANAKILLKLFDEGNKTKSRLNRHIAACAFWFAALATAIGAIYTIISLHVFGA